MVRILLAAALLAGCLKSNSVVCDDNSLCPTSTVCDLVHHGCVDQDQIDACNGLADLAPCTFSKGSGVCQQGVCLPSGCGNGRLDPGEMCDDGNQTALDGCSADCSSDEKCGNGVIDLGLGETCDDGNHADHDGCSSSCASEAPRWVETLASTPWARRHARAAYDAQRDRIVLGPGDNAADSPTLLSTWEWRGRWQPTAPVVPNDPHVNYAMAYDQSRGRVVMEGGMTGTASGDVYEWSGAAWQLVSTDGPPRGYHAMAYDAHRKRLVVFGGISPVIPLNPGTNTTFERDGLAWSQITITSPPPARIDASMTYDPDRGVILMYGGRAAFNTTVAMSDFWKYDGATWTPLAAGPPALQGASFAYSTQSHRAILYGGFTSTGTPSPQTWAWNGSAWSQIVGGTVPPARGYAALVDDGRGQLQLFGGDITVNGSSLLADTYVFDGAAWAATAVPAARFDFGIASDVDRKRVVVFGGHIQNTSSTETWELSDKGWQRLATVGPGAYDAPGMIYDPKRHETLLFGGNSSAPSNETWVWNGAIWTKKTPANSPLPCRYHSLHYDTEHGTVLVFGCNTTADGNDLWSWDGTTWTMLQPAHKPPIRRTAELGYDAIRHQLVLFGGSNSTTFQAFRDTWVYEQGDWHQVTAPPGRDTPTERGLFPSVWNPTRHAVTMIGSDGLIDAWEWDGTWWRRSDALSPPPYRTQFRIAPSPDGTALDLWWGGAPLNENWQLRSETTGAPEVCGPGGDRDNDGLSGCADDDCWTVCTPECSPGEVCDPTAPHCGDGVCNNAETCHSCPTDCTSCGAVCGDFVCDPGETCLGDCP